MLKLSPAGRRYGAHRSLPDPRDLKFDLAEIPTFTRVKLHWKWPFFEKVNLQREDHIIRTGAEELVNLDPWAGHRKNQSSLGACTGFSGSGARELLFNRYPEFEKRKDIAPGDIVLSPLFTYWWNRRNDGKLEVESGQEVLGNILKYIPEDRGATMRALMRTLRWQGVCLEQEDPYAPQRFTEKPTLAALDEAMDFRGGTYRSLDDIEQWKECLRAGYPIMIAMEVFDSFEYFTTARTGICPMPLADEKMVGGHAVLVIGYDEKNQWFIVRNSWGADWGQNGNFMMPYAYARQHVYEAWMMHHPKP